MATTIAQNQKADDPALVRTRKQVQILDDIYKSAIVLITENYVTESSDLAAGAAFQKLFDVVRKKGYHDVRLLDATGEPYEKKNLPQDDFEKAAIAALKAGKPAPEQIVEKDGKRYPANGDADSRRDEEMRDVPPGVRESARRSGDRRAGLHDRH